MRQHNLARDFLCKSEEMGKKKSKKIWSRRICLENIKAYVSGTFIQIDLCRTLFPCYVKETELKLA